MADSSHAAPRRTASTGASILVVDDDAAHRQRLRAALEEGGHPRVHAMDATHARALDAATTFDLILWEPGLGGERLDALTQVARAHPQAAIVFVTSLINPDATLHALSRGIHEYVPKPVDPFALRRVVGRALERRQATAENERLRHALGQSGESGPLDVDWPTLEVLERRYIERVMARAGGNKTQAAQMLGVNRRTLQRLFAKSKP
jgi:DNA-binding NtrC family response regulator